MYSFGGRKRKAFFRFYNRHFQVFSAIMANPFCMQSVRITSETGPGISLHKYTLYWMKRGFKREEKSRDASQLPNFKSLEKKLPPTLLSNSYYYSFWYFILFFLSKIIYYASTCILSIKRSEVKSWIFLEWHSLFLRGEREGGEV